MTDINAVITEKAKSLGFAQVYFLQPQKSTVEVEGLECDLPLHYPDFSCVVLLIYAYAPHKISEYVPAYYIASNKSYHAVRELMSQLGDMGIEAVRVHIPVKHMAESENIGAQGRNTLLHTAEFGSRMVLHTLLVKGAVPQKYNIPAPDLCATCDRCMRACPGGAITESGFIRERCIRDYMENPPYPDFVRENIRMYLGCDVCMSVCPYNAHIPYAEVAQEYRDILAPERILAGDVKEAKRLLGMNVSTGRLTADAEAISSEWRVESEEWS